MPEFIRSMLLGLSFLVVGMCAYMAWRHVVRLWTFRQSWDAWYLLIYVGTGIIVALIAELVWGVPGVPLTWRVVTFAFGLTAIGIGTIGVAASVGRRDKRSTDV